MTSVLFTESSPNMGGQERQLLQQMTAIQGRGLTVALACRPDAPIANEARSLGLDVVLMPFRNSADPPTIFALRRWLDEHRPDACLCHSAHDTNNLAAATRLLVERRPRVVRSRTYVAGHASSWTYNRLVDATAVPSKFLRRQVLAANPRIDPCRIDVMYPGVDFDLLERQAAISLPEPLETWLRTPASNCRLTVQVGNLRREKGHSVLLKALAQAAAKWPFRHVIAGAGPEEAAIRRCAEVLGLAERVWIGEVRTIGALLARADLLLMPSLYEPLGMASIEALGLGVPVLASDTGGLPEVVAHERNGRLVAPGDVRAWSEAVSTGIGELAYLKQLASRGRSEMRSRFAVEANTDALMRLIMKR